MKFQSQQKQCILVSTTARLTNWFRRHRNEMNYTDKVLLRLMQHQMFSKELWLFDKELNRTKLELTTMKMNALKEMIKLTEEHKTHMSSCNKTLISLMCPGREKNLECNWCWETIFECETQATNQITEGITHRTQKYMNKPKKKMIEIH